MQDLPFEFRTAGFKFQEIPWEYRWLNTGIITDMQQAQPFDDEGAGVAKMDGQYQFHPVNVSAFLMTRLDQYRILEDPAYLDLCIRQAERLMERAYYSRDAAYLPYNFEWHLHLQAAEPMHVPWFSGMGQGYALMGFSRLYELTGIERYLDFAHLLFNSYLNLRAPVEPWFAEILDGDLLWFEEYAQSNGPTDGAFNGHLYSAYGLHDYWMVTKDPRAEKLADGGMTSVLALMDRWRYPGGQSYYCTNHRSRVASYHGWHSKQVGQAFNITADPIWVQLQDLFINDYPIQIFPERLRSTLVVKPGTYQVGVAGDLNVTEHETIEFDEELRLSFNVRAKRIGETTVSVRTEDEAFKDMWFTEIPSQVYISGITEHFRWAHAVATEMVESNPALADFDENGEITGSASGTQQAGDAILISERAKIQGEEWFCIADEQHRGKWVAAHNVVPLST